VAVTLYESDSATLNQIRRFCRVSTASELATAYSVKTADDGSPTGNFTGNFAILGRELIPEQEIAALQPLLE
jgi:hypothetical protein